MTIKCICVHRSNDLELYVVDHPGAYVRDYSQRRGLDKLAWELYWYRLWLKDEEMVPFEPEIVEEYDQRDLDGLEDTTVLFQADRKPLTGKVYQKLKEIALRSASDLDTTYQHLQMMNHTEITVRALRGEKYRVGGEVYDHVVQMSDSYFRQIGIECPADASLLERRKKGFEMLEAKRGYLKNQVAVSGSGEEWTLRKVLRKLIWHDRNHARMLYYIGKGNQYGVAYGNLFCFDKR